LTGLSFQSDNTNLLVAVWGYKKNRVYWEAGLLGPLVWDPATVSPNVNFVVIYHIVVYHILVAFELTSYAIETRQNLSFLLLRAWVLW